MLAPTGFHLRLRDTLRAQEPGLFAWYASDGYETERNDRMRLELLRSSYRLSPESHERPHRIAREAAAKLGVEVPIVLYQLNSGEQANAGLCFTRDEAHVVISGPLLAALDDAELTALFGHELAHHRLFSVDDGTFRVAAELVEASASHAASGAAYVEAALRNRRWTEIYADRGAAIAAGSIEPAIACLVKVGTGLARVSAADYLAQAREVIAQLDAKDDRGSTHPENAVRAIALELWRDRPAEADAEIAKLVEGIVAIETLDITQQAAISERTRDALDRVLAPAWMRTDATLAHARRFFADYAWKDPVIVLERSHSESVDEYCAYVLLDFAVVDRELGEVALARALVTAVDLGIREPFVALARKELKATLKSLDALEDKAPALFEKAAAEDSAS